MKTNQLLIILFFASIFLGCSKQNPQRIEVKGVAQPSISLNGTWKFTMEPEVEFWENNIDFSNWSDIQVPGECQMQGFAIKHDEPYVYKNEIVVPEDYDGKTIQLNFYGVYSYARVWVNGNFVREHFGGFTKWECDITEYVKPGEKAILTIEIVDRADDISYGSGYAKHQIGGILRDVELSALPKSYLKKLYFETELDEEYENAELNIFYELNQNVPAKIKMDLMDGSSIIASTEEEINSISGKIVIPVEKPQKWDAEHPNLYTIVTTLLEDGKETMKTSEKIGFREVEVDGNRLLVNGMPVKLRGACRHDIHPTLGRMTTPEYDLKDVFLAKECNMNFIRTSHYPPSEKFLEYCDQYGIYVEDETAVCFVGSHRTEAYRATGASQSNPDFTQRYLSQLEEMVQNHRNHPSIIIWSIGNENKFGSNFTESYKWMKNNDLTRPIIYSYPGQVPDSLINYEIISMHYPSWQGNLNQYGVETKGFESKDKPMLFDEWAHVACYNNFEIKEDPNVREFWGQSLDSMWTYIFDTQGGLGGAIWCMLDETFMLPENMEGFNQWWGILDKNVIPATYAGPTVGYGEWGIVDTWRRKKPEFWGTKKAYSPTKIYTKQINDFQPNKELFVPVHNRFDHTNFAELKITWKYGEQTGEINNIDLAPHKRGELVVPANNWNSKEKLNIQFFSNDTSLVDEYNIQLGEKEYTIPSCKPGTLNVKEKNDFVYISGKNYKVQVNKATGLLENLKVNNELLVKSGPHINFRVPGKAIQYSTIQMDNKATNWKLKEFKFENNAGIVKIITKGTYDEITANFEIELDESGVINVSYKIENDMLDKTIQEFGIKFITADQFNKLAWDRQPYFTAYPKGHMGNARGEIDLNLKPKMIYREQPTHDWEMDSQGYYYFGLHEESSYTNIARALKENIYTYSLSTVTNSKVEVLVNGNQACRYDKTDGENTLIINNIWDYNSLLWGNYSKQIKCTKTIGGEVTLLFQ